MRSRDLIKLEAERAAERAANPPPAPRERVLRIRKTKGRWDLDRLRSEVEGEFRAVGARVYREERRS